MSIPFVQGRTFESQDKAEDAIKKVIINETLANMYWPNENPIGKRISMEWGAMLHAEIDALPPTERGTLHWLMTPKQLRQLATRRAK